MKPLNERIASNIQWQINHSIISIALPSATWLISWAIIHFLRLYFTGQTFSEFKIGPWLASSATFALGWTLHTIWLKSHFKKDEKDQKNGGEF